jgi:hypothetical protein
MHLLAPGTGRVDAAGGVTGQKPPLDGTLQGGVEGDVVVPDGPGAETTLSVPPTPAPPPAGTHILNFSYNFYGPYAIATDGDEFVYVSDRDQILKFTLNGTLVDTWGGEESGGSPGQFNGPAGIGVDAGGFVYVADAGNQRVQKFTSAGTFVTEWGTSAPYGLTVDSSGNVLTVQTNECNVRKFDSAGTVVASWEFEKPHTCAGFGIATDANNNVYITDLSTDRVRKFDSMGNAISSWTGGGSGFYNPRGIDIDLSGDVYVVDNDNQRIQKSNGNGSFLALWAAGNNPMDVAVDNFGSVYSTDASLGIVSKWTSGE